MTMLAMMMRRGLKAGGGPVSLLNSPINRISGLQKPWCAAVPGIGGDKGNGERGKSMQQVRWFGTRHKITQLEDAVALVMNGDTITCSGFVAQGAPEALLAGLGKRFRETGEPKDLTIVFGGGPGDFDSKGLGHLAQEGMLKRAVGAHYGQVPKVSKMALENKIEAYNIPMGSISRMLRATASGVPGHITKVGLGTFVDPRNGGGKINERTTHDLVELIKIDGQEYLRYKPIPIRVSFIRATTADPDGNLTFERESLLNDARIMAMAARSSGGLAIAQVERVAAAGSLRPREVHIPGALIDCVVVGSPEDSKMSYFTTYNPYWSGEIMEQMDEFTPLELSPRKVIARRGTLELRPDNIVNLGIGMPEGVAKVAQEENIFANVTLTTEPGVFGGVGASGHEFGPASGAVAIQEMNEQFDFYNGGGLDICFLGLAQCSEEGNVNVSRLSENNLTGPGGFIDITQCTSKVVFLGTFTKKGLKVKCIPDGNGEHKLEIEQEGSIKTFQKKVREITFSASQALQHGQNVQYITERAVFKLTTKGLELREVAPGIDIEKDIIAMMDFEPIVCHEKLRTMDQRIFKESKMGLFEDLFRAESSWRRRAVYNECSHTVYIDLSNFFITSHDQIESIRKVFFSELDRITNGGKQKVFVVTNYRGFDCRIECLDAWEKMVQEAEEKYYSGANRISQTRMFRKKLAQDLHVRSEDEIWDALTGGNPTLTPECLRVSLKELHGMKVPHQVLNRMMAGKLELKRSEFPGLLQRIMSYEMHGKIVDMDDFEE